MEKVKYIVNILIVVLFFFVIAIGRDGKLVGKEVPEILQPKHEKEVVIEPIEESLADGTRVINSASLAKDILGFGGHTPIKIYIKDDIIQKVEAAENAETPSFWAEVVKAGIFERWNGMTLSDAATAKIDAVSGATMSSVAVIGNVARAAQYGADVKIENNNFFSNLDLKTILGVLVVLMGALITLKKWKNKRLMTLQLVLNVTVLGFWCGSFLSLSTFTAWAANGVNFSLSIITVTMAVVVLIMPLFNRKGSYCHIHCPMGSAQELVGRVKVRKLKFKPKVNKFLGNLRYYILVALLVLMWCGVGFNLMNYEVFSAFLFSSASIVVLIMAVVFLILSAFTPKPYCRFVCPTGAILTVLQKTKE